jgi:heme/copper-type cytochrome/quinol oxidase subunit 3
MRLRFTSLQTRPTTMTTIPYAHTTRPDTGTTNARLGMWLFLASDAMLMASLFSGYVLLRSGADRVPSLPLSWIRLLIEGLCLLSVVLLVRPGLIGRSALAAAGVFVRDMQRMLWVAEAHALLCALLLTLDLLWSGARPRDHVVIASWFVLVAAHLVHVLAGVVATIWVADRIDLADAPRSIARLGALRLYWSMVFAIWLALVVVYAL